MFHDPDVAINAFRVALKLRPEVKTPNPGSPEATAQGCTCPVIDNGRGAGAWGDPGLFWRTLGCPLHAPMPPIEGHHNLIKDLEANHGR